MQYINVISAKLQYSPDGPQIHINEPEIDDGYFLSLKQYICPLRLHRNKKIEYPRCSILCNHIEIGKLVSVQHFKALACDKSLNDQELVSCITKNIVLGY